MDATTPLLDMEQAHLSFVRRPDSETDSTMPSLRRLVQPTDSGMMKKGASFISNDKLVGSFNCVYFHLFPSYFNDSS